MAAADLARALMPSIGVFFIWSAKDQRDLMAAIAANSAKLDKLIQQGAIEMIDLTQLTANIKDLQDQVTYEQGVDASAVVAFHGLSDQVAALAAEVASLKAGTVTQDQIDAVASTISGAATAIKANASGLAAAISAPGGTPPTTEPAPPADGTPADGAPATT